MHINLKKNYKTKELILANHVTLIKHYRCGHNNSELYGENKV